jgi:Flp pilus assembly protein TadD
MPLAALAALVLCACHASQPIVQPRPSALNTMPSTASEFRIADAALQSGNVQMASSIYERELSTHPDSLPALQGLGDALYMTGDIARARQLYEKALQVAPGKREPSIGLARIAIRDRRFDDAIALYRPLVSANASDGLAWEGLGTAYDLKGDHDTAQTTYRAGLKANPADMALRSNLGLSLVLGGNPREGANVLLDIASAPDAPPQARQNLALAYGVLGNGDAAGRILSMDLPKASVKDNLRYYEQVRTLLANVRTVAPHTGPGLGLESGSGSRSRPDAGAALETQTPLIH